MGNNPVEVGAQGLLLVDCYYNRFLPSNTEDTYIYEVDGQGIQEGFRCPFIVSPEGRGRIGWWRICHPFIAI